MGVDNSFAKRINKLVFNIPCVHVSGVKIWTAVLKVDEERHQKNNRKLCVKILPFIYFIFVNSIERQSNI